MPNPATSFSPTSRVLHRLGCLIIGTPESMHMPRDFYREKGDRDLPTATEILDHKVQRDRIAVNTYRLQLFPRVGWLTFIAALILVALIHATVGPLAKAARHHAEKAQQAELMAQQCDAIKRNNASANGGFQTPLPTECK